MTEGSERAQLPGDAVLAPSRGFVLGLVAAIAASMFLGVLLGRGGLLDFAKDSVLLEMRANRALVAFLCGGALSVAGAVVQTLFRNPLASPQILGTTSGATIANRMMNGPTTLAYQLYTDAGRTTIFGDGSSGNSAVDVTGAGYGVPQNVIVYGRVLQADAASASGGNYTDTVQVLIDL